MKNFTSRIYQLYIKVLNSLAFYPSIIASAFFFFSFLVMYLEYQSVMISIRNYLGPVLVEGVENARLILGTIVASIFSLMVFSFSMVMLVLNRASATLSPRVIPGLITKKSHQIVLGFYIGTIVYSLILITNIQSQEAEYQIPSIGILVAMMFAITCLGLFVYFIDSISKSIQVDNILNQIYDQTKEQIERVDEDEPQPLLPDTDGWHTIYANTNGYFKQIQNKRLLKVCTENDLQVVVTEQIGFFVIKGYPIVKISKKPDDDEVLKEIRNCFIFYIEEHVADHYLFGFKQISEIAVKALSPGINDPGTAVKAMDLLAILFIKKMKINEQNHASDDENRVRVFYRQPDMEHLMFVNLTPIREYGKADATVMLKFLDCLKNMAFADRESQEFQELITKYIRSSVRACNSHIKNSVDIEQIDKMVGRINGLLSEDYTVTVIEDME